MKVGFSLSRCIRDIYEGKVDLNDVIVIVARTNCDDTDESWDELWQGYRQRSGWSNPEWEDIPEEDEGKVREIYSDLFRYAKIHQPRKHGVHPERMRYYWLETFAPEEEISDHPTVKKAWDKYKMLAGLTNK